MKLSISASSIGSTRITYGPGLRPAIRNVLSATEKLPTSAPVCGLKATTCAPFTGALFKRTRPATMPVSSRKPPSGYEIGDARDVVGLKHTIRDHSATE